MKHEDEHGPLTDPLAPSDEEPRAGLDEVRQVLRSCRSNHVLVYDANAMFPRRLTHREAVEMVEGLDHRIDPCIITARFRGSDLVIRTIEWMGDPADPGKPRLPGSKGRRARPPKDTK